MSIMQTIGQAPLQRVVERDLAATIRRAAQRVWAWYVKATACAECWEREAFLNHARDHCDLEWRIRELDRTWAQSGFGIGGSRF